MEAVQSRNCIGAVVSVEAVVALDALKRKLPDWKYITFYGKHDLWRYVEKDDERLCPICRELATKVIWFGDALRYFFPYHQIMDENTIRVRAHMPRDDNCRCILERYIGEPEEVT